ncbi:MAG: hypothetical protein INR65_09730 [Gluconacetobacter diazotrophicus]|nr:hypothetical protein [Gluconacetobacter diazotrophicus]
MSRRTLGRRIHPAGPLLAFCVGVGGWASVTLGVPPDRVGVAAHNLGLALTMVFGILAATWWRLAAVLANRVLDLDAVEAEPDAARHSAAMVRDGNTLNACAATATALGLIASGFISVPWGGPGAWASVGAFLLVLAVWGDDLHQAAGISAREHLGPRSLMSLVLVVVALLIFACNRTAS